MGMRTSGAQPACSSASSKKRCCSVTPAMIRLPTVETLAAHNPPWRAAHFSKPISTVGIYVYTLLCAWCNLAASDRMRQGSRRFMRCDRLWTEARLATLAGDGLGLVAHGVLAVDRSEQ